MRREEQGNAVGDEWNPGEMTKCGQNAKRKVGVVETTQCPHFGISIITNREEIF